jgi:hypothetical protein
MELDDAVNNYTRDATRVIVINRIRINVTLTIANKCLLVIAWGFAKGINTYLT